MSLKSYEQLDVWQRAMDLVTLVYLETQGFPREETYGLTNQMRRASVSIASNIAEGQGRRGTKEFLNHLSMARGSLMEVETQAEIGKRLGYLMPPRFQMIREATETVERLLNGLIRALEQKD
jgi:four helix bundle protein